MSIEPTQADRMLVEAIINDYHTTRLDSDYVSHILSKPRTQAALARHRLASTPASGEGVAWMYERNGKVRISHGERSEDMLPAWTETPLYAAPSHPAADLVEALRKAESAIAEYYRYWTGGETRGSYDGKPERRGLWEAQRDARAALSRYAGGA